jgi:hypothetical protein
MKSFLSLHQAERPQGAGGTTQESIPRAVKNETFHTNPKRERGNDLTTSLTLRVSVVSGRVQYNHKGTEKIEDWKSGMKYL